MSTGSPDRLFELFNAALDAEGEARQHIFRQADEEDPALGAELRRKVAQFSEADEHFESSPFGRISEMVAPKEADPTDSWGEAYGDVVDMENAPTIGLSMSAMPDLEIPMEDPEEIGAYKIERKIGEGGMGAVYLARQSRPHRQVALKLIHRNKVSPTFLNRFNQEYSVLALMKHHNIATIYEAGSTLMGDPYFTMEYVDGMPINEYCKEKQLNLRDRLLLFIQVCDGVLHAHQKAVVHRDLKPNNIMVTEESGRSVVKLIDFGIAKSLDNQETAYQTQAGMFMGTPVYMGPEQIEQGGGGDIRSDIYALGVVLYELLTGLPPIDPSKIENASLYDMLRHYKDTEPPRPSERLKETLAGEALHHFALDLKGDLDWVVMKALEKNLDRRYQTAVELKADLTAFLDGEPVSARPPSWSYQFSKFIQRNKLLVLAGVLVFAALIGALVVSRSALKRAEIELSRQEQTIIFLEDILSAPDPRHGGVETRIVDALEDAEARLEDVTDKILEANIRTMLGNTYYGLAQYPKSEQHHQRAYDIHLEIYGPDGMQTNRSEYFLARVWRRDQQYTRAKDSFERLGYQQTSALGRNHAYTLDSLEGLAITLNNMGRNKEAINLYERIIDDLGLMDSIHDRRMSRLLHGIARSLFKQGKYERALTFFKKAIIVQEKTIGPVHPETLATKFNKANALQALHRYQDALQLFNEVLQIRKANFGIDHRLTIRTEYSTALCLADMDRYEEAESHVVRVVNYRYQDKGLESDSTVRSLHVYAFILNKLDEPDEALAILDNVYKQTSLEDWKKVRPYTSLNLLGSLFVERGMNTDAYGILEQNRIELEQINGSESQRFENLLMLGRLHMKEQLFEQAARYFCQAWGVFEDRLFYRESLLSRAELAGALIELGRYNEAEGHLKFCLEHKEKMAPQDRTKPEQLLELLAKTRRATPHRQ